jgi:hypothetical protein
VASSVQAEAAVIAAGEMDKASEEVFAALNEMAERRDVRERSSHEQCHTIYN